MSAKIDGKTELLEDKVLLKTLVVSLKSGNNYVLTETGAAFWSLL